MLKNLKSDPVWSDGYDEGKRAGYDDGYSDGYEAGHSDAERSALTEADLYPIFLDEVLDRLARHYAATFPALAEELRRVADDGNHPSRIHDSYPPSFKGSR